MIEPYKKMVLFCGYLNSLTKDINSFFPDLLLISGCVPVLRVSKLPELSKNTATTATKLEKNLCGHLQPLDQLGTTWHRDF